MTASLRLGSSLALVALLALGVAAPADAATVLVTPAVLGPYGDSMQCGMVNAGTTPITVRIELRDPAGAPYFVDTGVVVKPGSAVSRGVYISPYAGIEAYCKFVGSYNKLLVRASIAVRSSADSRTGVIAHAE
jgi:hypothetical protein